MKKLRDLTRKLIASAIAGCVLGMSPVAAIAAEEIPPEVVAAFDRSTVAEAKAYAASGVPEVTGVDGHGPIHQVNTFSSEFSHGKEGPALVAQEIWAANFLKGKEPVGVIMMWRHGGSIEFATASGDPAEAMGLSQVTGTYVWAPEFAAQFDLRGDTLVALDPWALALVGVHEQALASAQPTIVAAVKANEVYASAHPNAVGGGAAGGAGGERSSLPWGVPVAAAAMLVGLGVLSRRSGSASC